MNAHVRDVMTSVVKDVVVECTKGSAEERLSFPQVVMKLMAAGVERYHADLCRSERTYYMPDGSSEVVAAHDVAMPMAQEFSPAGVEAAVRAIQAGTIGYQEFCARIAAAGCVGYQVSLAGRRAVYYGRTGATYVEPFPAAK
jgi:uncharacterized protein YbcV (DUF1398 family)